ncbi:MAG: outer membrane protein assembly factor BamD [Flavobacterium sp.]
MAKYFYILFIAILFASCSPFQKALKSEDVKFKYEVAEQMYNKGKYEKAIRLFEQIQGSYRGKPQAEKLFYMFSMSYYNTKQYIVAGYELEKFSSQYPRSEKSEEAAFLGAKAFYYESPVYSLEQGDTYKAIDKLQNFINEYPNSQYMGEANMIMKELREKLEKKAYEIAKGYNTIMDYKAAIKSLDNFLIDFPGTKYKEDALYYKYDSAYMLAINSVESRMEERLLAAKSNYAALMKFNAETKYKNDADEKLARIESELKKYSK